MSASELNIDLFIATHCPHCAQALELLSTAVKQGTISRLNIINLNALTVAEQYSHIRSVPFIQVGDYEFAGQLKQSELVALVNAHQEQNLADYYFSSLLMAGNIGQVENFMQRKPEYWLALVKLVQNPDSAMQVRIGITAIFESISSEIASLPQRDEIILGLIQATKTDNHAIRVDLVYILSLLFSALKDQQQSNSKLNHFMELALNDTSGEIKEIAEEVLH